MGLTWWWFTAKNKAEALQTVVCDSDDSIASVAQNLGLHEMTWGAWVKKAPRGGVSYVIGHRFAVTRSALVGGLSQYEASDAYPNRCRRVLRSTLPGPRVGNSATTITSRGAA